MTRQEIREENEKIFQEYEQMKIRKVSGMYDKLCAKYNYAKPTIWRKIAEARKRLGNAKKL